MAVPFILDENAIRGSPVLQMIHFERLLKEMLTLLSWSGWAALPDGPRSNIGAVIQFNNAERVVDPRVRRSPNPVQRQMPDLVASCPLAPAGENNAVAETAAVGAARPAAVRRRDETFAAMVRAQNDGGTLTDGRVISRAANNASNATWARAANDASDATRARAANAIATYSARLENARDVMIRALNSGRLSAEHVATVHAAAIAADAIAARIANDAAAPTAAGPTARPANAPAARAASAPAANASAAHDANAAPVVHAAGAPAADPRTLTLQVELCADCYYHGNGRKLKVIGVTRLERTTTAAAAAAEGHQHHQNHVVPILVDDADLIHHISAACRNLAQLPSEDHHADRHHDQSSQSRETAAGYGSIVAKHLAQTLLNRSTIESSILTAVFVVVGLKMFDRR